MQIQKNKKAKGKSPDRKGGDSICIPNSETTLKNLEDQIQKEAEPEMICPNCKEPISKCGYWRIEGLTPVEKKKG